MNKKLFYIVVFLIFGILLVGCSGIAPSTSTGITGNWTMTNTTTSSTHPVVFPVGNVTTAKCNIVDKSGSLTIYNFKIIGSEFVNWNTGYGTFKNSVINANISGSYLNTFGATVSTIIYFEGIISTNGISGSGNWVHTISVYGNIDSASGSTIFIKG